MFHLFYLDKIFVASCAKFVSFFLSFFSLILKKKHGSRTNAMLEHFERVRNLLWRKLMDYRSFVIKCYVTFATV